MSYEDNMSEIGLRILAELPDTVSRDIAQGLRDDINIPTEELATNVVRMMNSGQVYSLARVAIGAQIDAKRRSLMRGRETRAMNFTPTAAGRRRERIAQRKATLVADAERLGCAPTSEAVHDATMMLISDQIAAAQRAYREEVRLQLTQELLTTGFADGVGNWVTWGAATVEQHAARADMLEKQGVSTIETSFRHRVAIDTIEAAGATDLNHVQAQDAVA